MNVTIDVTMNEVVRYEEDGKTYRMYLGKLAEGVYVVKTKSVFLLQEQEDDRVFRGSVNSEAYLSAWDFIARCSVNGSTFRRVKWTSKRYDLIVGRPANTIVAK